MRVPTALLRVVSQAGRTGSIPGRLPALFASTLWMASLCVVCLVGAPALGADQAESAKPSATPVAKSGTGAPETDEKKPAAPAAPVAPAAKGGPSPGAAPAAGKARPAPAPRPTPEPVLRFTDDDLLKYREPLPEDEYENEADTEDAPGGTPAAPAAVGPAGPAAAPAQGTEPRHGAAAAAANAAPPAAETAKPPAWAAPPLPPPPRPPASTAVPPVVDPLREHHAREADRARRAAQIDAVRAELASIDGRLSYLRQKRQAIVDPLNIMPAGRTEEERQANADLKPKELLDQVDQQIKDLEKQRESVQERLASIESRFGGGE